jgi:hypothetical protein
MGMVFCASHKNNPLKLIEIIAISIPQNFEDMVWDNFSPSGQPISKTPANIR